MAVHNYLDDQKQPREVRRVHKKDSKEESASDDLSTRRGVGMKGVAQGQSRMTVETGQVSNEISRVVVDGGWEMCHKRLEGRNEQAQRGRVKAKGDGCAGKEGERQQCSPNDCDVERYGSDYGEESFESTDESGHGCLEVGTDEERSSSAGRGDDVEVIENNVGRRREPACSSQGARTEKLLLEENTAAATAATAAAAAAAAAAVRIESCWRGFLGRCAAKVALRSALLVALRSIGGGKMSKVTEVPLPW